jgi:hypothetical protein
MEMELLLNHGVHLEYQQQLLFKQWHLLEMYFMLDYLIHQQFYLQWFGVVM